MEDVATEHKSHRKKSAGVKAEKKKGKGKHVQDQTARERNPKAFTFRSMAKAYRLFRREQDIKAKKHHVPKVDRNPLEPPPVVVAVVGGARSGKSTLIRSLIGSYTREHLSNLYGPITVVASRKRRITFLEVPNDINCLVDVAKIADVALIIIDATFGFELEVFEFLEVCRAHGMPCVMGVLNHMDKIKNQSTLQKTKRKLRNRFRCELYPGAKFFYMRGLYTNGYHKNDVINLCRFVANAKQLPIAWRSNHPYILVDRYEDTTNQELVRQNPKIDRTIALYGYVRGVPLQANQKVHIMGVGDFDLSMVTHLDDPCPLPSAQKKNRKLLEKERKIYAPMAGVSGVVYDKDAIYVDVRGIESMSRERSEATAIVEPLMSLQTTVDEKQKATAFQMFKEEEEEFSDEEEEDQNEEEKNGMYQKSGGLSYEEVSQPDGRIRRKVIFEEQPGGNGDEEEPDFEEEYISEEDEEQEESDEEGEPPMKKPRKKEDLPSSSLLHEEEGSDDEEYDLEEELKRMVSKLDREEEDHLQDLIGTFDKDDTVYSPKVATGGVPPEEGSGKMEEAVKARNENRHIVERINSVLCALKRERRERKVESMGSRSGGSGDVNSSHETEAGHPGRVTSAFASLPVVSFPTTTPGYMDFDDPSTAPVSRRKRKPMFDESEASDNEQEMSAEDDFRAEMFRKASENFLNWNTVAQLQRLIYDEDIQEHCGSVQTEEADGLFIKRVMHRSPNQPSTFKSEGSYHEETSRFCPPQYMTWENEETRGVIRDCFVTGDWGEADAERLLKMDDEDVFGDFEDLETGERHDTADDDEEKRPEELKQQQEKEKTRKERTAEKRLKRKLRLKELFNAEYDAKDDCYEELKKLTNQQLQLNRSAFEELDEETRITYEGYRPGLYVRMEVKDVPYEFLEHFDPTFPVIVGGLLIPETNMNFVRVRIKVHRWYPRILKCRDPLVLSLGWRRFQTMVYFGKREDDMRLRYLKYARKYLHVEGLFWGPATPVSTGFVAFQDISSHKMAHFSIAANGVVLEMDQSTRLTKKLKLIGHPYEIMHKTVFVKDMFHSDIEVTKFTGAKIQTQSGIRGFVKKSVGMEGRFRAGFEDVIRKSDLVVLKTWVEVVVAKFFLLVKNLLLPLDSRGSWSGMRPMALLKKKKALPEAIQDHLYTPIEQRVPFVERPVKVPRALQRALPFDFKPRHATRITIPQRVTDVVTNKTEVQVDKLLKHLRAIVKEKKLQEEEKAKKKLLQYKQQEEARNQHREKGIEQKKKQVAFLRRIRQGQKQ